MYTWIIWAITQGTATFGLWYGGAKWGAFALFVTEVLVILIILLSFKFGTKNIKKIDTFLLVMALLAVFVWWQFKNPLLSVLMVSAIDGLGYVPTLRKSFFDPWSETLSFWAMMAIGDILVILSNAQYNFLTTTYPATLAAANIILLAECLVRRAMLKPNNKSAGQYNVNLKQNG